MIVLERSNRNMMAGLYVQLGIVAAAFASLSAVFWNAALCNSFHQLWIRVISGLAGTLFLLVATTYIWILSQRPSRRQSLLNVTAHLLMSVSMWLYGKYAFSALLETCKDPMRHQRLLWQKIIKANGRTAYVREHRLTDATTLEKLRDVHPLTNYEPYRPYVDRMLEGERDLLVDGLPDTYVKTTGTTGKSKYIPVKNKTQLMMKIGVLWNYVTDYNYPGKLLSKCFHLFVAPKVVKTKIGARIEPVATMPEGKSWVYAKFCTPPAGYRISLLREALYVELLFALLDPEVDSLLSGFLHFLESSMMLLEKEWKTLVNDIETGTINADLDLPPDIRDSVTNELKKYGADPARAAQLRKEFEQGFEGIIKRIWPCIPVIMGVDSTGSWPRMSATYAKGVALIQIGYGCSESNLGISPGPNYVGRGYIPLVKDAVMEFIKEEDMSMSDPPTLFLDEIKEGQNYEIVVTQPFGLYRYRMGDVITVTEFYKEMPIIDFLYRTGQMLNLRYEKLDQRVVLESIRAATRQWRDRTLIEFAVAESTLLTEECSIYEPGQVMPYYVFFLEMKDSGKPLSEEEKKMIDIELQKRNSDVERLRREGAIADPRIHVVRPGAFAALEQYLLTNTGASANQYKVPRKLRTLAMLNVMIENIVN